VVRATAAPPGAPKSGHFFSLTPRVPRDFPELIQVKAASLGEPRIRTTKGGSNARSDETDGGLVSGRKYFTMVAWPN
jgi:hypothetical protein